MLAVNGVTVRFGKRILLKNKLDFHHKISYDDKKR